LPNTKPEVYPLYKGKTFNGQNRPNNLLERPKSRLNDELVLV